MPFLLADSSQSSQDKLNGEEQKPAKLAAFELQINPANPGLQCHRLDNISDRNFWIEPVATPESRRPLSKLTEADLLG